MALYSVLGVGTAAALSMDGSARLTPVGGTGTKIYKSQWGQYQNVGRTESEDALSFYSSKVDLWLLRYRPKTWRELGMNLSYSSR